MRSSHAVPFVAVAIATMLTAPPARGHHSFAPHFDAKKPANISGTITEYEARNPHSYLHIAAVDENGRTREYVCESHGVTQLSRNGITPAMLRVGARIRVTGSMSRHSLHVPPRHGRAGGRQGTSRQRPTATARGDGGTQGHLRHLAAGTDPEPADQRPAADDRAADAGG